MYIYIYTKFLCKLYIFLYDNRICGYTNKTISTQIDRDVEHTNAKHIRSE